MYSSGRQHLHREGLVKIHVANITAAGGRVGQTDLGVQIGTIQVDLAAVIMDDLARLHQHVRSSIIYYRGRNERLTSCTPCSKTPKVEG